MSSPPTARRAVLQLELWRFPLTVEPGALVLAGLAFLYGLQAGSLSWALGLVLIALLSLLVHELGHALVARRYGLEPIRIRLTATGGLTRHRRPQRTQRTLWIVLAGPAAGFALASLGWALGQLPLGEAWASATGLVFGLNLLWSMFNLLPVAPLDGGMALLALCRILIPSQAERITLGVGMAVSLSMAGLALWLSEPFLLIFAGWFAARNGQALWQKLRPGSGRDRG